MRASVAQRSGSTQSTVKIEYTIVGELIGCEKYRGVSDLIGRCDTSRRSILEVFLF
jgi:hypothetical protein